MISYVLPTHDRAGILAQTLQELGALPAHDANVIVVDNASSPRVAVPNRLANGLTVELVRLTTNIATAARNAGVSRAIQIAGGPARDDHWIVMLDDDSSPLSTNFLPVLASLPGEVAVLAAEVLLPDADDGTIRHEAGGLPEVFIGCGAAIRASVFAGVSGYDSSFDYYAEEYDLSARILLEGLYVRFDRRFVVRHRKVSAGRDMSRILANLVRNNGWVMARYAPDTLRDELVREQITRYGRIAHAEHAWDGYLRGVSELALTLHAQPRCQMPMDIWQRFTGFAAVRSHLQQLGTLGLTSIVERGKHAEVIEDAAQASGIQLVADPADAQALLIGTMSPGPMLDAAAQLSSNTRCRVVTPWALESSLSCGAVATAVSTR